MKKDLSYLLILRWASLAQVVILLVLGKNIGPSLVLPVVVCYCLFLTYVWERAVHLAKKHPVLIELDLLVAGILIWLTGGGSKSPYFLYAFSSLTLLPFFLDLRASLLSTAGFSILYTIGFVINSRYIPDIILHRDLDTLISNYVAFFLTTIFFGHPALVIRNTEKALNDTAIIGERIAKMDNLIAAASRPKPLSPREQEVMDLVMVGKTNAQIAEELYVSEKTVKSHLYQAYKKLGVCSRSEAILQRLNTVSKTEK